MRSFKKVAAVALSAVMTLAMGVSAFADQTITFHFQNSSNWNPCGAWIYQGIAFTTNVTPIDKSPVVTDEVLEDGTPNKKIVWPGAKMDADSKQGWVSVSATFTDSYTTQFNQLTNNIENFSKNISLVEIQHLQAINSIKQMGMSQFIEHVVDFEELQIKQNENLQNENIKNDGSNAIEDFKSAITNSIQCLDVIQQENLKNNNNNNQEQKIDDNASVMSSSNSVAFTGNFDGDGHTVSGMFINTTSTHNGLFGNSSGIVQNLLVENSWVAWLWYRLLLGGSRFLCGN